ncbi:N-acetyl-D-glucosamine kinase [Nymphon striatum]|nr:N-acetyl-D-glucosamine kinase [Nymphon striatum]
MACSSNSEALHSVGWKWLPACHKPIGGTKSTVTLILEDGTNLCVIHGADTNFWALGMEKCLDVISDLIKEGLRKSGFEENTKLHSLGLCMSGCEGEDAINEVKNAFTQRYPDIAHSIHIASDTVGSVLTASPKGGIVLIAGTGSNSLLLNEDGSFARCGGWGHMVGDQGGAFWIADKGVKCVFDSEDNFNSIKQNCSKVKKVMMEHFNVKDRTEMLKHYYSDFNKSQFAGMCAKLAKVARDERDPLCCELFRQAGEQLGCYVKALQPKINKASTLQDGGIRIVCVGSVFKSWDLLKDGFIEGLDGCLDEFTLLQLQVSAAVGAAFFAAKEIGNNLPIDFKSNVKVMFHFKKE